MFFHPRSRLSMLVTVVPVVLLLLLSSTTKPSNAFSVGLMAPARRVSSSSSTELCSSPDDGNHESNKPDLVAQAVFKAAIRRIEDEIEAQYKAQKVADGTATESPSTEEQQWLEERARQRQEQETTGVTLVGKLDVTLPIDTQPELDLTESIGPLVLVTSCWGRTAEATGIQEFDTLTKVSVDDPAQPFVAKTKGTTLEETAGALTAAAQHALSLGKTEIQLEVQRLIQGYYAPPE